MRCKDCGTHITWDNSYGKVEYLICEECWHSMVLDTDLPTAYAILMAKGDRHAQALQDLENIMIENKAVLIRLKER